MLAPMTESEPHLLVVDDDARLRELLRRYLADNGFRVTLAADAEEGIGAFLEKRRPKWRGE